MQLGISFALDAEQVAVFESLAEDEARVEWLDGLEEHLRFDRCLEFDKDWAELHRCLGDGSLEIVDGGSPRAHAVFGSRAVMDNDDTEVFAGLLPAGELAAVVADVDLIDKAELRRLFNERIGERAEVFTAVYATFIELRSFLRAAADTGATIVFTVAD